MYASNEVSSDMEKMEYDDIIISHTTPIHPTKRFKKFERIKK